jgi:hypothetical protein
MRERPGSSDVA